MIFQNVIVNDCLEAVFSNKRYEKQSKIIVKKIKKTFLGQNMLDFTYSV